MVVNFCKKEDASVHGGNAEWERVGKCVEVNLGQFRRGSIP